ncbi:hypothetical protein HDU67_009586 [Dinochytrium kinnereticum]|nr:hypothetical protein HDU67_009586 [Dinochytrium kinnereticum]
MLIEADEFVKKQALQKFMQRFVNRQNVEARLLGFHQELASISQDLALAIEIDLKQWREEDREDRASDLAELEITLQHLIDNDYKILNALELKQQEYLEAMEALQKNLAEHVDRSLERNLERLFMEKALAQLRRVSQNVPAPVVYDWVITSWEVDIGETIAKGGFGEVARGVWLGHTQVAVKRLFVRLDTNRLKEDFMREVKAWYPLRHPHVLPLLGACATAERPFMVSPFMHSGHALQYLDKFPNDIVRVKRLLYEVSQGMQYLHSRRVIHGDLKAINILVDENGKAYVSDFGFAYLKKVTSTRQTSATSQVAGTLRWMAPERLSGGSPTAAVDVYAFAMTCYELITEGDIPLSNLPDSLIYQAVVNNNARPSRPEECSNVMWDLITQCWHPDPLQRPSFASIYVTTKSVLADVEAGIGRNESDETKAQVEEDLTPAIPVEKDLDVVVQLRDAKEGKAEELASDPPMELRHQALRSVPPQKPEIDATDSGFGSMASSRNRDHGHPQHGARSEASAVSMDSFKLSFEEGSPGDYVSKLADGMPLRVQSELHRKMAEFGKALNSGSIVVQGGSDLQTFARDLQRATSASSDSRLKGKAFGTSPFSGSSESSIASLESEDSLSEDEAGIDHNGDEIPAEGSSSQFMSPKSLKEMKKLAKQRRKLERQQQRHVKRQLHGNASSGNGQHHHHQDPRSLGRPSSNEKKGSGILSNLWTALFSTTSDENGSSAHLGVEGGRHSRGRGGRGGHMLNGNRSLPPFPQEVQLAASALDRRIPNEDARSFWKHYWGVDTFEVTLSDFLSCLEEYFRGGVNRNAVCSIVKPVEGTRGEKMVATAGLNALVGDSPTLVEALRRVNSLKCKLDGQDRPPELDPNHVKDGSGGSPPPLSPIHPPSLTERQGSFPAGFPSYYGDDWDGSPRGSQSSIPPPVYMTREFPPAPRPPHLSALQSNAPPPPNHPPPPIHPSPVRLARLGSQTEQLHQIQAQHSQMQAQHALMHAMQRQSQANHQKQQHQAILASGMYLPTPPVVYVPPHSSQPSHPPPPPPPPAPPAPPAAPDIPPVPLNWDPEGDTR